MSTENIIHGKCVIRYIIAAAVCRNSRIVSPSNRHLRVNTHRRRIDREIFRNVLEKNRKCDRGILLCHCTAFYASHSTVAAAAGRDPSTRSRRVRNSALEIYLHFDEAPSYPHYFLRKHKSPVGIVY